MLVKIIKYRKFPSGWELTDVIWLGEEEIKRLPPDWWEALKELERTSRQSRRPAGSEG